MNTDANRCLKCMNPKCQNSCPIHTPIPEIIKLYQNNDLYKAGELLFNNNPFSYVCSLVCDHESQCFGNCILNFKNEPIHFYEIEQEISKHYLYNHEFTRKISNNHRIAVVGGGPAGITVAIILAEKGYDVTIFEAHEKIGGVLRYGIPEVRLSKKIIDRFEEIIKDLGIKVRPNTTIGPTISIDRLLNDSYEAVFIGTGVWNPKTLDIQGETLGHVHYAIDFLKSPNVYDIKHKKVIVIGAGNVAMDAARTAASKGGDVSIYYRKSFNEMPATKKEIEDTKNDGVKFEIYNAPKIITNNSIIFEKTENIIEEGKIKTKIIPNTQYEVPCDIVIIAVSQSPRTNITQTSKDLIFKNNGLLQTDELGNTSKKGVFASGDVVTGAKTVVLAINNAKIVANTIDNYITNQQNNND